MHINFQINWIVDEVQENDVVALMKENPEGKSFDLDFIEKFFLNDTNATLTKEEENLASNVVLFAARPYATEGRITKTLSLGRPSVRKNKS